MEGSCSSSSSARYSADALELKALCTPLGMAFMLSVERDLKAVTTSHPVRFPSLAPTFRRLLTLCAARFGLTVSDATDSTSNPPSAVVSGNSITPLLQYADFLPGAIPVPAILSVIGHQLTHIGAENSYSDYASDSPETPHGIGYHIMLDLGLPLATHAHLIRFEVRDDSVKQLMQFIGTDEVDVRYDPIPTVAGHKSGIIIMPSPADAAEVFERYEDEETGDDEALGFVIRPVASCVPVPYVDDAHIKKIRSQYWPKIVDRWRATPPPINHNAVIVTNFSEKAVDEDITKLFDEFRYAEAVMLPDSRGKRRKLFVRFKDAEGARLALEIDGRNLHGRALRVQVAPPLPKQDIANRWGRAAASPSMTPAAAVTPAATPPSTSSKKMNVQAKEFVPGGSFGSTTPPYSHAPQNDSFGNLPQLPPPPPYSFSAAMYGRSPHMYAMPPPPAYPGVLPPPAYGEEYYTLEGGYDDEGGEYEEHSLPPPPA